MHATKPFLGLRLPPCLPWVAKASVAGLTCALLMTGCQTPGHGPTAWQKTLEAELPTLGHRNWIVVADSAYPDQISPGVEVIYTGAGQLKVVETVLATVEQAGHVQPVVHLDAELADVPESQAPGVDAYRNELARRLQGLPVVRLPHEELIAELDEVGRTFRILILKTDLKIPYTSVFLRLDCGYWGADAERQLREAISRKPEH